MASSMRSVVLSVIANAPGKDGQVVSSIPPPAATETAQSLSVGRPSLCYSAHMKVEEIAEAVANLPPDQLARFRRWFTAFEAGRTDHAEELDSAATKLGRLAGRAFVELKRRVKEP